MGDGTSERCPTTRQPPGGSRASQSSPVQPDKMPHVRLVLPRRQREQSSDIAHAEGNCSLRPGQHWVAIPPRRWCRRHVRAPPPLPHSTRRGRNNSSSAGACPGAPPKKIRLSASTSTKVNFLRISSVEIVPNSFGQLSKPGRGKRGHQENNHRVSPNLRLEGPQGGHCGIGASPSSPTEKVS